MPHYDLKTLCTSQNIRFGYHRAGSDSDATAQLSLKAFEEKEIYSKSVFSEKLQITICKLFKGGYISSICFKENKSILKS